MGKAKMSKSRGNVANPFEAIQLFGLDTLRFFLMRVVREPEEHFRKTMYPRNNEPLAHEEKTILHTDPRKSRAIENPCAELVLPIPVSDLLDELYIR